MIQVGVTQWSLEAKLLVPHPLCSGCGKGEPRWQPWRMGKSKWDRDKGYVSTWLGESRNDTCQSVGFDSSYSPVLQLSNSAVRRHGRTHTIHAHTHTHTHASPQCQDHWIQKGSPSQPHDILRTLPSFCPRAVLRGKFSHSKTRGKWCTSKAPCYYCLL